jgi:hypothetical protein
MRFISEIMDNYKIQFNEEEYLEMYPDVKQAIESGVITSAHDHYMWYGKAEGRKGLKGFNFVDHTSIPKYFQKRIHIKYPPDIESIFEEWFFDNYNPKFDTTDRVYLPVFWTGYFVSSCNYGMETSKIELLQDFINSLDRDKKYYTILNYDDGCLIDFRDLDIIIFTASGKGENGSKCTNIPIPLLGKPHKELSLKKDIYCSFVGRLVTHPLRQKIYDLYKSDKRFYFEENVSLDRFCEITSRSKYVIAPRGYGINSFRIYEALQYGAIPVFVSDVHLAPFGIDNFYVKVFDFQVSMMMDIIGNVDKFESEQYLKRGSIFYKEYCSFVNLKNQLLTIIKQIK